MSTTGNDIAVGSEKIIENKEECTSCEQNNVDNITDDINSVAMLDNISICAACGKEGNSDNMNNCNKCKMVKYCNAACKKKHRSKHKKACERRVAELHDEKLFKEPPPQEECPICLQILPPAEKTIVESCCGKRICNGCIFAMQISEGKDLCAFCRTPNAKTDEEHIKRTKKLMDKGNAEAHYMLAGCYARGMKGLPQDWAKAIELLLKAGELGSAVAYFNLGCSYVIGEGIDKEKAEHYWELAAMGGDIDARYYLGREDYRTGNHQRAMKHWIISAKAGHKESLEIVKKGFMKGLVTKDEYANTLRAYHERQKEMKSDQRDKAVASGLFRNNT